MQVAVLSDQPIFLRGIQSIFNDLPDFECNGCTSTYNNLDSVPWNEIRICIVQTNKKQHEDLDTIAITSTKYNWVDFILISDNMTYYNYEVYKNNGVNGFLDNSVSQKELTLCLKLVSSGQRYLGTSLRTFFKLNGFSFSLREMQIVKMVEEGLGNKQIAEDLSLSEFTIQTHVKNLMAKMTSNNRTHLIQQLKKRKII